MTRRAYNDVQTITQTIKDCTRTPLNTERKLHTNRIHLLEMLLHSDEISQQISIICLLQDIFHNICYSQYQVFEICQL